MTTPPLLNPEQQAAYDALVNYVRNPQDSPHRWWLLLGYAGTGKSFTIGKVIQHLRQNLLQVKTVMSAPTHKALKVLRRFGPSDVSYATIHSLLGCVMQINERTGAVSFPPSKDPKEDRLEQFDLLILDESSMLNAELFDKLHEYCENNPQLRVIFVGDGGQLPPIGEKISKVFGAAKEYNLGILPLTRIVRQAKGNPVLAFATSLRNKEHKDLREFVGSTEQGKLALISRFEEVKEVLQRYFCTPEFREDADYMKVLAYRNVTVNQYNTLIRQLIYKEQFQAGTLEEFMEGEKIVMDSPYVYQREPFLKSLSTNEELTVNSVMPSRLVFEYRTCVIRKGADGLERIIHNNADIPCLEILATFVDVNFKKKQVRMKVLPRKSQEEFDDILERIASSAKGLSYNNPDKKNLWKEFFKVKEKVAHVKYNYAITCHKSQGSTYDNVLMIDVDILVNHNRHELPLMRYVAATRVRKNLYILV
jgi:exodeoxyribonuclease-5